MAVPSQPHTTRPNHDHALALPTNTSPAEILEKCADERCFAAALQSLIPGESRRSIAVFHHLAGMPSCRHGPRIGETTQSPETVDIYRWFKPLKMSKLDSPPIQEIMGPD